MTASARKTIRFAAAAYALALAVLSLLPSGSGPLKGWDADLTPSVQNLLHVPAYAALAVLVISAVPPGSRNRGKWAALAAAGCAAFGALLELAQAAIPGRSGSAADMLLNFAGIGLTLVAIVCWNALAGPAMRPDEESI